MISIIIVHYHVKKELFACLASIYASKPKSPFEIIVVNNDEKNIIEKELKKKFAKVRYIKNENKGFGQGNNVGARHAKGELLFFLNPDTTFLNNVIDALIAFLHKQKDAAIVAPLLFDKNKKAYVLQGLKQLTPFKAIFALSFIQKLFPQNKIYKEYYMQNWDKKSVRDVDVVPGTALVVRKKIFEEVKGFDEKFFLYFEEFDLCKRIRDRGEKIFITPLAKVFHAWGSSTKKSEKDISTVFKRSRFHYFKKHFGLFKALGTEAFLRVNKYTVFLAIFFALGACLRLFNLEKTMDFIGDQGWYYLSARDMILTGNIPLVGIPSSHPWIHQGAYWTYLLGPVLWLFQYHPVSGAYLTIFLGLVSIWAMYKLGSLMFSKNVGLIASFLFATSPFVVFSDRMPYHTSPIPLVTIFALIALYKWIQGNMYYFPLLIVFLAVLYNFELATFLLGIIVIAMWMYGFIMKKEWARKIFAKNILLLTIGGWLFVMLPMLIHDLSHGFPQTLKFLAWVGYRILVFVGYPAINPINPVSLQDMAGFVIRSYEQLVFASGGVIALLLFLVSCAVLISRIFASSKKQSYILLGVINLFLLAGLFIVKTPSGAYFPLLFPGLILMIALVIETLVSNKNRVIRWVGVIGLLVLVVSNSLFIIQRTTTDTLFLKKIATASSIVKEAGGKEYNLIGQGPSSEFASFTMNYEYLVWWLGHGPSRSEQQLQFLISETNGDILVEKKVLPIN